MPGKYYFFPEDMVKLEGKITALNERIKELGEEQAEVAAQSTENFGHDDFPQEAVKEQRSLVVIQLDRFNRIRKNAIVYTPKKDASGTVKFGSILELNDGRKIRIGSFLVLAEYDMQNISYQSDLAKALIGKKAGDQVHFRKEHFVITSIK